jgi:hypothetical protein
VEVGSVDKASAKKNALSIFKFDTERSNMKVLQSRKYITDNA